MCLGHLSGNIMKKPPCLSAKLLACSFFFISNASLAEDIATPNVAVTGSITLVNDYIWRGQSQTWGNPALQVGLEVNHISGIYGGVWTSNVSNQWVPGGHIETDFYTGYRNALPDSWSEFHYDLNLLYAYYPEANFDQARFTPRLKSTQPNGLEASVAVNYKWLSLKTGRVLTSFYGWNTNNSPVGAFAGDPTAGVTGSTRGSWFIEANANYEFSPGWSLNGQVGRETIRNSHNLDWNYYKTGVTRSMGTWAANLSYSASSELAAINNFIGLNNNGDSYDAMKPRILVSVSRGF